MAGDVDPQPLGEALEDGDGVGDGDGDGVGDGDGDGVTTVAGDGDASTGTRGGRSSATAPAATIVIAMIVSAGR